MIILHLFLIYVLTILCCFFLQKNDEDYYETVGDVLNELNPIYWIPVLNTICIICYIIISMVFIICKILRIDKLIKIIMNIKLKR
jgi:hypothetical protein